MMGEQPARGSANVIIFSATALLAVVVALGVAYGLWTELHRTSERAVLTAAVSALGAGTGLLGFAMDKLVTRLFLLVLGTTLILGFFFGGPIFGVINP